MRLPAVIALVLVVAACGGEADDGATGVSSPSSSPSTTASVVESTATTRRGTTTSNRHAMTSTSGATYGSGIRGRVTAGPTCPVQREGDTSCDDRPIVAHVTIRRADGSVQAQRDTGTDGRYAATVPPGRYIVEATTEQAMSCSPSEATVPADGYATADVSCDTGIR